MNTIARWWRRMIGDCDNCGHSVIYHLPIVGCQKCDCEEFE